MNFKDRDIFVSIVCVTYNHEKYIARALDSFLSQKVNFEMEIIVADDCSTDNTLEILYKYKNKFPALVQVLSASINMGAINNGRRAIEAARGKYISFCDGDDYFLDENKLQLSFDYMESNKQCSMLFTPALIIDEETGIKSIRNQYNSNELSRINLEWVLNSGGGFFPTVTSFYKSSLFSDPPEWLYNHSTGDYPFAIRAITKGTIGYFDKVTGCYWKNTNSISNKLYLKKQKAIEDFQERYNQNLHFFDQIFKYKIINLKTKKNLIAKEDYMYFAKLAHIGLFFRALKGVLLIRYRIFYKIRIILKVIFMCFYKKNFKITQN